MERERRHLRVHRAQDLQAAARSDGARNAEEVLIHELTHEAQRELGCVDEPDDQRFRWLMEGMAVYGARARR